MTFTEFLFDPESIDALVTERKAALKANRGLSDFKTFALSVIAGRIAKDPRRYVDYGPYWPALKEALYFAGYDYGERRWPMIGAVYRGKTEEQTIVMADEFRKFALATYFVYNNQWVLDSGSGEHWTLEDEDMERLARTKLG